ncbi:MAG: ABC transporter, partial [Verrucomicrobia bacterium]
MPSFASARRRRTAHLLAQAVLFLTLVAGLNYLATLHAWRFDISRHARHSLSAETLSYLKELTVPVQVFVTLTDDTTEEPIRQAYEDIRLLLRDYAEAPYLKEGATVTHEFIDIYKNRSEAEKYGINVANAIVVIAGQNRRVIELSELYRMKDREKIGFIGEQSLTAAILDVTRPGRQLVAFTSGHGELDPADTDPGRGLSLLRDELRLRNFDVGVLDLSNPLHREVATQSDVLVIAAPQGRFSPDEQEFLRRHLSQAAGRVLLLLNPRNPHGLDDLLYDWGVLADDVLILDPSPEGTADNGDLVLGPSATGHPIVSFLYDNRIALRFGPSRSVRADPGRALDPGLTVDSLLGASASAWGERAYRQGGVARFDEATDLPPRLSVGTASQRSNPRGAL